MTFNVCPVCKCDQAKGGPRRDGAHVEVVKCPRCGNFQLSSTLCRELEMKSDKEVAQKYAPRWVLSASIRNRYENGEEVSLQTNTVETLVEIARKPQDPFESINLLLRLIESRMSSPAEGVQFNKDYDYPLIYARSPKEFTFYIHKAQSLGLVEVADSGQGYRLGLEGWRRLKNIESERLKSDRAFVAMWFDDEVRPAYDEGIVPALNECGYTEHRIDDQEHNEMIDDRIIADIRQSGLLVADFTGQRSGVYFEAGFAKGIGIPVIWTCREDEVDELHFDTRQYNHITWEDPDDLKESLIDRIEATLPVY